MSKALPALSESALLRYINFIVLYIAQGIPEGLILFGIPAWMAMNGKSAGEVGTFVAAFGLPWSFKLVVAPLMDRFTYLPMGRRRPWVLFGQLGLILSFIAMAFVPDPLNNLGLLAGAAFAVGCFGSFQDVATDGMAIDVVPEHQQARANALMWGAKTIGISGSLALGSWLIAHHGFNQAILFLSIGVAMIMLVPLLFRERPGEKLLPWLPGTSSEETQQMQLGSWSLIFKSLFRVITLRNSLILLLILFLTQGSFNYIATLLPLFTVQELGWTDQEYAQSFATANLIGGITGMILGGILIDRFGKVVMLNVYFGLLVCLTTGFALSGNLWPSLWFIKGFMLVYSCLFVFTAIGLFAVAMQCCWKKVSASQFTFYMTVGNLGRIFGAKMIGTARANLSWEFTIVLFSCTILIAWVMLQFLFLKKHAAKIGELEGG